jgi:carbon starvation protein
VPELGAPKPWLALLTLIPLVWLVSVTFTAGIQKIWHSDTKIGFIAKAAEISDKTLPAAEAALKEAYVAAAKEIIPKPEVKAALDSAVATAASLRSQLFNNRLDAIIAAAFLTLVSAVILLSLREWWLLLSRRKPAVLHESEPVWLPDYAVKEGGANLRTAAGTAAIALGLAKELSGEAHIERAKQAEIVCVCEHHSDAAPKTDEQRYVEMTERRFNGPTRCC